MALLHGIAEKLRILAELYNNLGFLARTRFICKWEETLQLYMQGLYFVFSVDE
jgi:hypothetical protein